MNNALGYDSENLFVRISQRFGFITLVTIIIIILVGFLEPRFYSKLNQLNVLRNTAFLLLVAYGQMLVMIVGGFDLSVGAIAALGSIVGATVMQAIGGVQCDIDASCTASILLGMSAGILAGLLVGFLNGVIVAIGGVSPFMVTLAMMMAIEGFILFWTNGTPIYGLPELFTKQFGRGVFFNAPMIFWIGIVLGGFLWVFQNRTATGSHLYAIGGNLQSARNTGLAVNRITILAYTASGAFASLSGMFIAARIGSGQAGIGGSLMIESIAAAVIGGVSLRGGVGRVERVIIGCLLLAVMQNSLNLLRIESKFQSMVMGLVLLIAVALDQLGKKEGH